MNNRDLPDGATQQNSKRTYTMRDLFQSVKPPIEGAWTYNGLVFNGLDFPLQRRTLAHIPGFRYVCYSFVRMNIAH